jgi:hypothetical protein
MARRHAADEPLTEIDLGDHDLLGQIFFPKPVILVSTFSAEGEPNLAPYSQLFPRFADGVMTFQLVCRATSNTAQNIARSGHATLSFIPDDALVLANARLLAIPGTTAEKMTRNHFHLVQVTDAPPHVAEGVQVIEATWTREVVHSPSDSERCFVLTPNRLLMASHWQKLLESGQGVPAMPIDVGLKRPGTQWRSRPQRQTYTPRLRPRFESHVPLPANEVVARFSRAFEVKDGQIEGRVLGNHVRIGVSEGLRHIGSPQMELEVSEAGPFSKIEGRIGPNPQVWTLFLALHALVAIVGLGCTFFGLSQWLMDTTPWALIALPIGLALNLFIAGAAFIGQGLGADQTYLMRSFMDDLLAGSATNAAAPSPETTGPKPSTEPT